MLPCVLFKKHLFILIMYNFIKIILKKIVDMWQNKQGK